MTIHLIKLAVGIEDVAHLATVQALRLKQAQESDGLAALRHLTRHAPRRVTEVLESGSIYWVIKGGIRARQRILRIDTMDGEDGRCCALVLDPALVETQARAHRAFQGWRYLRPEDAPLDLATRNRDTNMPADMAAELRALGLL